MSEEEKCPLCHRPAPRHYDYKTGVFRYQCEHCGVFVLERNDEEDFLDNDRWRSTNSPAKISAVLSERHLHGAPRPFLLFRDRGKYTVHHSGGVHIEELLRDWSDSVPVRIERSLLTLVRRIGVGIAGREVTIQPTELTRFVPLAIHDGEPVYFFEAMQEYEWITQTKNRNPRRVGITPKGWEKFDELTRAQADVKNPVFVAMWFGRPQQDGDPDHSEQMLVLFEENIKTACTEAGWQAKRADTDEHNEPIMDRIIADIRKAPFLIADLTNNNQGVYYEAGLAHGLGREVIFCCPEGQKVHFDVTGINRVVYETPERLYDRLLNRILKTKGEGPFI